MKAVIFDFDGTIADTIPLCLSAFRRTIEPIINRTLSIEELDAAMGINEEGMIRQIVGHCNEDILNKFHTSYARMHSICPTLTDGIKDILQRLKDSNTLIALVTGKGYQSCRISLNYYGIYDKFDIIQTGSALKNIKANTIKQIITENNISQAIYIGDTPSDVYSSKEAGVECLSAAWIKNKHRAELCKINNGNIIDSIAQLHKRLTKEGYIK